MSPGDELLAETRCPHCDALLTAERVQRYVAVGGRWRPQGGPHWVLRCVNGHAGDGESMALAYERLRARPAISPSSR